MLDSVHEVVSAALESAAVPGAVVLVAVDGEPVHVDARGSAGAPTPDSGAQPDLSPDSIFWLASLSKVVCAAITLAVVADELVGLDDPVARYLPEFGREALVRVLAPGSPPVVPQPPWAPPPDPMPVWDRVAAEQDMTLRHLLTHTSGLQSIFVYNADYHRPQPGDTLATHVPTLAQVPRDFEAGTSWAYSNAAAFDVLARVLEVATGQGYDKLVRERITDPLGLSTIGFGMQNAPAAVPATVRSPDDPVVHAYRGYYSAAAGMWSSLVDYLSFVEMLRGGGVHRGRRILDEGLVALLTANQVGGLCPGINGRAETGGIGCGFSVAVIEDPLAAGSALPAGTFGWDGVNSRRFWSTPDGWSLIMFVPDDGVQRRIEAAVVSELS